jgi:hypothetical protein
VTDKIEAFLTEVRNAPGFVEASIADPKWLDQLAGIERGLKTVDREADNDPAMLDALDEIQAVIDRADLTLKQRLLKVGRILGELRDTLKIVH